MMYGLRTTVGVNVPPNGRICSPFVKSREQTSFISRVIKGCQRLRRTKLSCIVLLSCKISVEERFDKDLILYWSCILYSCIVQDDVFRLFTATSIWRMRCWLTRDTWLTEGEWVECFCFVQALQLCTVRCWNHLRRRNAKMNVETNGTALRSEMEVRRTRGC